MITNVKIEGLRPIFASIFAFLQKAGVSIMLAPLVLVVIVWGVKYGHYKRNAERFKQERPMVIFLSVLLVFAFVWFLYDQLVVVSKVLPSPFGS